MNNTLRHGPDSWGLSAYIWWATTLAWTVNIYLLSTETFGTSLTRWLLGEILGILNLEVSAGTFHLMHHVMRKAAHVTEYGIYALLLYGSMGGGRDFRWQWRRAAFCAAIAGAFSLTDELHQAFVPGRTASIMDSALDAGGAILGMAGVYVAQRVFQARGRKSSVSAASPAET